MKSLNFLFPEPQKIVLVEEDVPRLGPDTILIKTIVSHVSTGTESFCYRGIFDPGTLWDGWVKYPFRPGYSTAGQVIEVGKDVTDFKPGDLVYCGRPHGQYITIEYDDAAKAHHSPPLHKIPSELEPDEVIWSSMAGVAIVGCRKAKIEFGENVAVIGAGPIGQLTIQYAKICGAVRVVSIDPVQKRNDCALVSGATDVLTMDAESAVPEIEKLLGMQPEVIFDTTGNYKVLPIACEMVGLYGRIILNGDSPEPSKQVLGPTVVAKSLDISGCHGNKAGDIASLPWVGGRNQLMTFELMKQKRLKVKHLISHRYKPEEAPEVYDKLLHGRDYSMGVVFDW